jgi:hypothetical protein
VIGSQRRWTRSGRSRWRDARASCVNASVPCMSRALSLRTSAAVVCSAAAGDARLLRHAAVSPRVRARSSLGTGRAHRLGPHGRDARQRNTTRNREEWCPSGAFRSSYCRGRRWNRRPRERNADDGHRRYDSYREVGTVFVPVADQVRALEFYIGKLGCEKRADFPTGRSLDRGGPIGLSDRDRAGAAKRRSVRRLRRGALRARDRGHRGRPRNPPRQRRRSGPRRPRRRDGLVLRRLAGQREAA